MFYLKGSGGRIWDQETERGKSMLLDVLFGQCVSQLIDHYADIRCIMSENDFANESFKIE